MPGTQRASRSYLVNKPVYARTNEVGQLAELELEPRGTSGGS